MQRFSSQGEKDHDEFLQRKVRPKRPEQPARRRRALRLAQPRLDPEPILDRSRSKRRDERQERGEGLLRQRSRWRGDRAELALINSAHCWSSDTSISEACPAPTPTPVRSCAT